MNIALFGGTFDPPHYGHTQVASTLLDRGQFDQIWYVPVAIHGPLFTKDMSSINDRLAMLRLVQTGSTRVEEYEIKSGRPSHTHTTLRQLSRQYPEHQFSFLMGSDQLTKLNLWKCEEDQSCFPAAADEFAYYVYPRQGYPMELPYANLRTVEDVDPVAVSSTQIRHLVQTRKSISGLVDPAVERYIKEHQLYT